MTINVLMPALSPTMTEGTLAKWHVKEGDEVTSGDVLAEIETDKATMEVEAVDEGTVGKLLVDEGAEGVPVNQVIAVLLEEGEDADAIDVSAAQAAAPPPPAKQEEEAPEKPDKPDRQAKAEPEAKPEAKPGAKPEPAPAEAGKAPPGPRVDGERVFASPLARRMAAQAGLDLARIAGSGPHGRVVKRDIEKALKEGVPPKAAAAPAPGKAPAAAP
ncbi:MAG: biotin/lipoyl-containing protein, partial [Kiloniellales bacterium]|nr:biotin/lipoyl-containing protein [Kiloniellales bacterium]